MMKRLPIAFRYLSAALLLMLLSQSCINDDLSDCPKETRVYFSYMPARTYASTDVIREGIYPSDVTRMDLYIFDENGLFVKKITDESPEMSPEYYMTVPDMKAGNYKFVAWGDLEGQYSLSEDKLTPGKTSMDDLIVSLNGIGSNGLMTDSVKPLFYATYKEDDHLTIKNETDQRFLLDMIQNTHTIHVSVEGIPEKTLSEDENTYQLEITDSNSRFDFNDKFVSTKAFTYTNPCKKNIAEDLISSSLSVMKLADDRSPKLRVVNNQTHASVIEDNLVQLILKLRMLGVKVDFDHQHEFNIKYVLNPDNPTAITIYINGWKLILDDHDL